MILKSELTGKDVKVTANNYLNLFRKYNWEEELETAGRVPKFAQELGIHSQPSENKDGIAKMVVAEHETIPTFEELIWTISFLSEDGTFGTEDAKALDKAFNNGGN